MYFNKGAGPFTCFYTSSGHIAHAQCFTTGCYVVPKHCPVISQKGEKAERKLGSRLT